MHSARSVCQLHLHLHPAFPAATHVPINTSSRTLFRPALTYHLPFPHPCCSLLHPCFFVTPQPINLIFRFLQSKQRILVWLYEQPDSRIEGRIIGFDEYMNLVLDDAEEVSVKRKTRKPLGRILLKGDNITLMQTVKQQ